MKKEHQDISKIILKTVSAVGVIGVAVLAPNVLQVLNSRTKERNKYYIPTVLRNLQKKELITLEKNKKGTFVRLTSKGKDKLAKFKVVDYKIPRPKKWDGKYRIIIFDIHEYRRPTRDKLRKVLEGIGFVKLQNSVWVYPYDCREFVILLKASFKIGKDILYIEALSIENDSWIKKHFQLHK